MQFNMQREPGLQESSYSSHSKHDPEKYATFEEFHHTDRILPHLSVTKSSTDLPPFLKNLFTNGSQEPLNFETTLDDRPDWLELEKFQKGQKFGYENAVNIGFSMFLATCMVWCLEPVLLPFIFAGEINTPFKSFKRYTSTFLRVTSWVEEDVWTKNMNKARKNLKVVRSYHKNFHLKLQSTTEEEIMEGVSLKNEMNPSFNFLAKDVSKDVVSSCPVLSKMDDLKFGINQMNMSLIQFTFVGLTVTYPERFGIHNATDEDLESHIHVWRGLGFLLGIKDEYNFCNCNLDELRERTRDLIDLVIKPSFTNLSNRWEYIMRCGLDGPEFLPIKPEFEPTLLYLFDILKINSVSLRRRMSFYQLFYFYMLKFFFGFVTKIKHFLRLLNEITINSAKKSQKIDAETENQIKAKIYPYVAKKNNFNSVVTF